MPRPKVPGAPEPKKRSRHGCWACKSKKVKCGEEKPSCQNCERNGEAVCDYSIRLQWDGRSKRSKGASTPGAGESSAGMGSFTLAGPQSETSFASTESSRPAQNPPTRPKIPESEGSFGSFSYASPSDSTNDPGSPGFFDDSPSLPSSTMGPPPPPDFTGRSSAFDFASPAMSTGHQPKSRQISTPTTMYQHEPPEQPLPFLAHHYSITTSMSPRPVTAISSAAGSSIGMGESGFPLTPSASSVTSEENQINPARTSPLVPPTALYSRRLSVNTLLKQEESNTDQAFEYFGIDRGSPDLDAPTNDDAHALDTVTPVLGNSHFGNEQRKLSVEFGFGLYNEDGTPSLNCYAEPLQVKIATSLLPLPSLLLENPMNLMYFHFFIEYTARILVPHDCPANPFKIILPQMAVRDENLLKLLLAYSASHRARVLQHPLPSNRIAVWVSAVFPSLRLALEQPPRQVSDANVATAIMLASIEIIAPETFGVGVAWQDHLRVARRMIVARGGARAVDWRHDRVAYFLVRWFANLDVLGSFTSTALTAGGPRAAAVVADQPMFTADLYDFGRENDFQIDCLLGFSGRLAGILAAIADLARACDVRRAQFADPSHWRPDAATVARARQIQAELAAAREQPHTLCPHRASTASSPTSPPSAFGGAVHADRGAAEDAWAAAEMAATNEAFHCAGLLHLLRRVLGRQRADPEVQAAVRAVVTALARVRRGGSAEACMLFPLVSAGCEVEDAGQRAAILERVRSVEASGMTQVQRARRLLETVWSTGRPWETLVQGEEFFG